ncbi:DNA/RNA helicase, superfamily I [Leptolyngbya sp. PCC 7375]|nr:DNA/RNA helicase, superfamily I [Leptolyngbya sp. PCC 7375]
MKNPSKYQEAIKDHFHHSENDLLVDAKPGSGKSSTAEYVINTLPNPTKVLALAFTKTIAGSLTNRIPLSDCIHSHAYGKSFLKRSSYYEKNKYWEFTNFQGKSLVNQHQVSSSFVLVRLLELIRLSDTDIFCEDAQAIRNLSSMAYDYGLLGIRFFNDKLLDFTRKGIDWGIGWYKKTGQIDFADMLFLPVELNLDPPETYDYVFVDEVQDFSNIQIELMQLAVSDYYGKLLMVGDQNQACFKFAGAGKASIPSIKERLQPDVLPLSICYRCPTSHIELANQIYPGMEARPGAPEGEIYTWNDGYTQSQLKHLANPGDLIICRRVAPLIEQCLDFILAEIPAVVKGKGVKESLFRTFDEIQNQRGFKYSKVFDYANKWHDYWKNYFVEEYENPDTAIQDITDRYNQVIACIQAFNANSFSSLKKQIEYIFNDKSGAIQLSSIHSAKGLEADSVFVMEADKLPFKFPGMTKDDKIQESNLEYITKTRSKEKLYLLPKEEED